MKNTSYTEVARASKNWLLIFNTSLLPKQEFRNQKFNLVRLSNYFVWVRFGSIVELNPWIEFGLVRLSSIEIQFDWARLTTPGLGMLGLTFLCRDIEKYVFFLPPFNTILLFLRLQHCNQMTIILSYSLNFHIVHYIKHEYRVDFRCPVILTQVKKVR